MNDPAELEREEYPGELRELRAVLSAIASRGCLECQLRASVAARTHRRWPRSIVSPTAFRLGRPLHLVAKERE
jgi:hypothetical protein